MSQVPNLRVSIDAGSNDKEENGITLDYDEKSDVKTDTDKDADDVSTVVVDLQRRRDSSDDDDDSSGSSSSEDEQEATTAAMEQDEEDAAEVLEKKIDQLYLDLGINANNAKERDRIRFDAIHLYGTGRMTSADIFEMFGEEEPEEIEEIDNSRCNVVFAKHHAAAKWMVESTKVLRRVKHTQKVNEDDYQSPLVSAQGKRSRKSSQAQYQIAYDALPDEVEVDKIRYSIPAGPWRVAKPHPKSDLILARFASKVLAETRRDEYTAVSKADGSKRTVLPREAFVEEIADEAEFVEEGLDQEEVQYIVKFGSTPSDLRSRLGKRHFPETVEDEYYQQDYDDMEAGPSFGDYARRPRKGFDPSRLGKPRGRGEYLYRSSGDEAESEDDFERPGGKRMRMHADVEEAKMQKRLRSNRIRTRRPFMANRVRDRVGFRRDPRELRSYQVQDFADDALEDIQVVVK